MCFLHFRFWKYVLLTTSSFVPFCFKIAFTPLIVGGAALIWKPVKWFTQQTGWLVSVWDSTDAINGIISEWHSSQLSRTSFSMAKKRRKNHSNRFNLNPYPYNGQGLLIKTKVFCWCSLITVLYLLKKKRLSQFNSKVNNSEE